MKSKILNFLLIIFSLFGYLEWSGNQHIFLFEAEIEIFSKLFNFIKTPLMPIKKAVKMNFIILNQSEQLLPFITNSISNF